MRTYLYSFDILEGQMNKRLKFRETFVIDIPYKLVDHIYHVQKQFI